MSPSFFSRLRGDKPLHERVHEMTFWEHVDELRGAVVGALIALAVTTAIGWALSGRALDAIVQRTTGTAVFLSPLEAFGARMRVAFALGVVLALPVVAYRLWRFVVPGLLPGERSLLTPFVMLSVVLFYAGTAFGLLLLSPTMIRVLLAFGTEHITPQIAVGSTLGFILGMSLTCGVVFQLPLALAILARAGIVTPRMLLERWREATVIIFLASAFLTPGDALSTLVLLGVPVLLLYFFSIALAAMVRRRPASEEVVHAPGD
jgi:sec-independent protein translocase protein TatC